MRFGINGTVRLWDPSAGQLVSVIQAQHTVTGCSRVGDALAVTFDAGLPVVDLL